MARKALAKEKGLYQRKGSPFWWYRFTWAGTQHRQSTGETDLEAARTVLIRKQLEARETIAVIPKGTIADRMARDINDLTTRKKSHGYIQATQIAWTHMARILHGLIPIASITDAHVGTYVSTRRGEGVRDDTICRELEYLTRARRDMDLPPLRLPTFEKDQPCEKRRGIARQPWEVRAFLEALQDAARVNALIAAVTGMRFEEIARLNVKWIDAQGDAHLPAWATKSKRARTVPMGQAAAPFRLLCERKGTNTPFWKAKGVPPSDPSIMIPGKPISHRTAIRSASARAGLKRRMHLRDLRHTFATETFHKSQDQISVMRLLGHTDVASFAIYQHSSTERERKAAAAGSAYLADLA